MKRILRLTQREVTSKILVILLSGLGIVRSQAFISTNTEQLKNVSKLYIKMSEIMDIETIGWLLFLFSLVLLSSSFFKEGVSQILLIVGCAICGTIHILFGMIGVDTANLPSTYYSNMLIGVVQYLVLLTGVNELWKMKK